MLKGTLDMQKRSSFRIVADSQRPIAEHDWSEDIYLDLFRVRRDGPRPRISHAALHSGDRF